MTQPPTDQPRPPGRRIPRRSEAFTLVELMISIALVLILILGINQVFSITSKGVAGGQALDAAISDNRAAQAVFYDDMRGIVFPANASGASFDNGPGLVIRSERQYAYRNRADHLSDSIDGAGREDPTATDIRDRDLNGDNDEADADEDTFPPVYNDRSHRVDRMAYFARGQFRRQTGGTVATGDVDPFVANMSSPEAFIWYGHLSLPDISSPTAGNPPAPPEYAHRAPGDASAANGYANNRDNAYASQWVLGRVVLAMRQPLSTGEIFDKETGGAAQNYIDRPDYPLNPTPAQILTYYGSLAPFAVGSTATDGTYEVQWSRYDLAGTTIEEYRDVIQGHYFRHYVLNPGGVEPWWTTITETRYQGNPVPNRPLNARGVARTAPVFLRGCSQFVVEFAGDFVTQDRDPTSSTFGNVSADNPPLPDGVTDFVVHFQEQGTANGTIDNAAERATLRRVTRWYGMPRDTNGDNSIPGWATGVLNNEMPDVVPLRDVVSSGIEVRYTPVFNSGYELEQWEPDADPDGLAPQAEYAQATNGMKSDARYVAAWGPDAHLVPKPRLIRFTIAIDEPSASMAQEQMYEYIIELP